MDLELRVKIPNRSCPGVIVDPPEERLIFRRQHLLKPRSSFSRPSFSLGFVDRSSHRRGAFQLYGSRFTRGSVSVRVSENSVNHACGTESLLQLIHCPPST